MKRISEIIITIIVLGVIVYSFGVKADRDPLISTGKEIMLELAPIDPLSLLQGQYMIINFALENDEVDVEEDEINPNRVNSGFRFTRIVLRCNESGVATFNRFEDGQPLNSDEVLFNAKKSLLRKGSPNKAKYFYKISVPQNSFLFKENTEKKYEEAKYGVFKVGPDGDFVLVDLADKDLNKLTLIEAQ